MNTETGAIYRGEDEIKAAQERGEPVVPVSQRVAELINAGKIRQAEENLRRTQPNMTEVEIRQLAIKVAQVR